MWTWAKVSVWPDSKDSLLTTSHFFSSYYTSSYKPVKRVNRLQPAKSSACSVCRTGHIDTLQHAIFNCEANKCSAAAMLKCAQCYSPGLTADGLLRLEVDVQDPFTLPTVTIIATGLELIWTSRMKTTTTREAAMRAELQATRHNC